ncbi:uncharacterized protein LOC142168990 [Nicotiana tabacum]|uniref:Uncharacterized protein LOC142168990 n=1 Tax=Nicotiana tabacum TaxID=4097 RepID=A0AC58SMT0_TOBAC
MPLHLLSALSPPKTDLKKIEKLAANLFWGMEKDKKKYHWSSWNKLSFPIIEGGIGFRTMEYACQLMRFKQWWTFRTKSSLWSNILRAKYCQRSHPISKKWDTGQSQAWKKMMTNKKKQKNIFNGGCILEIVVFGGIIGWVQVHFLITEVKGVDQGKITVAHFWENGQWNLQKLNRASLTYMIHLVIQISIHYMPQSQDLPIWTPTVIGQFTCASAWERALRNMLPTDDRVISFGNPTVIRCVCCIRPIAETVYHIFSRGNFATFV